MANIYLEKIAGIVRIGKQTAVLGRDAAKYLGKQVHLSTGGAYIDHALSKGIKDPAKISEIVGARGNRKEFRKAMQKATGTKAGKTHSETRENIKHSMGTTAGKNNDFDRLKNSTTRARIVTGAAGVGSFYAGSKIKKKIEDIKSRSKGNYNSQYTYSY